MKKLNLQLDSIKEMLTKEQMKKIVGGYNPNCNGVGDGIDWYCRSGDSCTHIGIMSCDAASNSCSGGTITNSPTC